MNLSIEILYKGQENLITLLSALIISQIFLKERLFLVYAAHVFPNNRKLQLLATSLFAGMLPIDGRITVSMPLYKDLAGNCAHHSDHSMCESQKMGIVSYLATHHYYLWSPLEKSVIIMMAGLHLTYMQFMSYTLPLLCVYLSFLIYYIMTNIKNDEIKVSVPKKSAIILPFLMGLVAALFVPAYYVFASVASFYAFYFRFVPRIDVLLIVQVALVIMLSNFLGLNSKVLLSYFEGVDQSVLTVSLLSVTAFASFVLGSSSKYAGIITSICSTFGMSLFPILFALDYAGYLLSFTHKCTIIAHRSFKTPVLEFYRSVSQLALLLVSTGALIYFVG